MSSSLLRVVAFGLWAFFSIACMGADSLKLPMPTPNQALESYCQQLDNVALPIRYRCVSEDNMLDAGSPKMLRRLEIVTADFSQMFRIGRALIGIPQSLRIPAHGPTVEKLSEPTDPGFRFSSELTIKRSGSGQVQSVQYELYNDGGVSRGSVGRMAGGMIFIEVSGVGD